MLNCIAVGAALASTQALAQMPQHHRVVLDMTRAQAADRAGALFLFYDVNHDGTITRKEAQTSADRWGDRGQKTIDRVFEHAQSLTVQQFQALQLVEFDRQDLNHDGILTAAERQQTQAKPTGQPAAAARSPQ